MQIRAQALSNMNIKMDISFTKFTKHSV